MLKRAYIEITNACNLHCDFCHGTSRAPQTMDIATFSKILDSLTGTTKYIYFHVMGEPLLHEEVGYFLTLAGEKGYRVCLTTNGTLLKERLADLVGKPSLHKVSVSLHSFEGNAQENDVNKYLKEVWESVECLSNEGVICSLRLWNIGGKDRLNKVIEEFLSAKIQKSVKSLTVDGAGNIRLDHNIYLEKAEKFDWPDINERERETQYCYALKQQVAILVDGTVVPCCLDADGKIPLGNILDNTLSEILQTERAKCMTEGFRRRSPSEELCKRCGFATRFNR